MRLKHLLFFSILLAANSAFSCDCPPPKMKTFAENSLTNSEIAFYGEVIKSDSLTRTYTFKIIELFKGKANSIYIQGKEFNSCSLFPQTKQLWIVYAQYEKGKIIDISLCSPSRGFMPYESSYPPPLPKNIYSNIGNKQTQALFEQVHELQYEKDNLADWIYQLEKLRAYKKSQKEISDKEKAETKLETYSRYIIISLIVNIVLLLSLIFNFLKKKKFAK